MEINKESKDIIKMLNDRQIARAQQKKEVLLKQANDLMSNFQRESIVTANSFSNIIGNLNRIQAEFAKLEGIEEGSSYFEQMMDGTF